MEFVRALSIGFLVLWILGAGGKMVMGLQPPCKFPAIYNFGDSNSDTGGISAAFLPAPPPNGETFFGKPSGRSCDGRLIIDFMAEYLGLPYLSPYLDSLGAHFRHGANFATGGSTIRMQNESLFDGGASPFALNAQIWQFQQFKARATELYNQAKHPSYRNNLPKPEDFPKALFTLDIGQNDLAAGFRKMSDAQILASIPDILDQFSLAFQNLYQQGARTFWIHNTGPIGCLPSLIYFSSGASALDSIGCIKSHNDIAMEFNKQLKERVLSLRSQLSDAALTYVDVYATKYELISTTKVLGMSQTEQEKVPSSDSRVAGLLVDPMQICCGHHEGNTHIWCGQKMNINGTEVFGASCKNPANYTSWDGVHYTEGANRRIANHIINGETSDPPIRISQACYKHGG